MRFDENKFVSLSSLKHFLNRFSILFLFAVITRTRCFDLKCSFETTYWWPKVYQVKQCTASDLTITSPNQTVTSINGKIDSHTDVNGFHAFNQQIRFFPHGIEKFLPNLTLISISNSKLQSIEQFDLKTFPLLKHLRLEYNEIEVISDDLFAYNPELQTVTFDYNHKLRAIGHNWIPGGLVEANFIESGCISNFADTKNDLTGLQAEIQKTCLTPEEFKKQFMNISS